MRVRSLALCSLGVIVGLAFAQAACTSSSTDGTPAADAGNGGNDIEIGMSDSLTGGLAGLGVPLQNAVKVAEQAINQAGVLGGRHIKFKIVDDASDKGTAVINAVNGLLGENVPVILGPLSSGQALAVQQAIATKKVLQLSATATSPLLTTAQPKHDRYFFRTAPPDDFQGRAITKFIYDGVARIGSDAGVVGGGCKKVSLVNGDDGYGNALIAVVKQTLMTKAGTTIATEDKVPTTLATDYKMLAAKIVAAQPECLVLVVYSDVGAQFLRDLNAAITADTSGHNWSKFYVSGSDGEYDTAFIPAGQKNPADPKSPNSTEGCYGTTPDPAPDTTEYAAFRNLWQQSFPGTEPDAYTANQYDAAILVGLAIQQAGTATDGTKIRDALYAVTGTTGSTFGPDKFLEAVSAISKGIAIQYKGASGPCKFDDYGNVTGDYIVWHVEKQMDGTFAFATVGKIKSSELQ